MTSQQNLGITTGYSKSREFNRSLRISVFSPLKNLLLVRLLIGEFIAVLPETLSWWTLEVKFIPESSKHKRYCKSPTFPKNLYSSSPWHQTNLTTKSRSLIHLWVILTFFPSLGSNFTPLLRRENSFALGLGRRLGSHTSNSNMRWAGNFPYKTHPPTFIVTVIPRPSTSITRRAACPRPRWPFYLVTLLLVFFLYW